MHICVVIDCEFEMFATIISWQLYGSAVWNLVNIYQVRCTCKFGL